ncbi:hypothetical protein MTHERMMSTA1_10960 [Methanosarcina thermophila MST-A1]|nr:hypothetical protein MTHERMMSTA1_10960 [Methanosarcina thermophila MST-A1]
MSLKALEVLLKASKCFRSISFTESLGVLLKHYLTSDLALDIRLRLKFYANLFTLVLLVGLTMSAIIFIPNI